MTPRDRAIEFLERHKLHAPPGAIEELALIIASADDALLLVMAMAEDAVQRLERIFGAKVATEKP